MRRGEGEGDGEEMKRERRWRGRGEGGRDGQGESGICLRAREIWRENVRGRERNVLVLMGE
jgi:hypothetical protein